jgi:hypothetical protein
MKPTLLSTALAVVLGLAFVGAPALAQTATTATAPAPAASTKTKTTKIPYKGTITAVDATSITITAASGSMTFSITPATKYKGGKAITDFAVNDVVTGSYIKNADGTMTAASVHKKVAAK